MRSSAQASMRTAYNNGGPGVIFSGLVWLIAAILTQAHSFEVGIIGFFIGGMFIHPLSLLVSKKINTGAAPPDKSMTRLALFTLPILFGGLYIAYLASLQNPMLFYPVVAIAIGLRYTIFKYIYGLSHYILLGLVLVVIGAASLFVLPPLIVVPLVVGVIEILIGLLLLRKT